MIVRPYEQISTGKVTFVREQDGVPERSLKDRLAEYFRRGSVVEAAYLASATIDRKRDVILALRVNSEAARNSIVKEIAQIFASLFGCGQHLDILFLTPAQELDLLKVCKHFFRRRPA